MFREEISGKVALTRQQTILMAAGLMIALTAILLVLAGITLLLSQWLVTGAGWQPLLAGGAACVIVAVVFALTGWLIFRSSGQRLKKEGLAPSQTLQTLRRTAHSLTNQPIIPTPPPNHMNNREQLQDHLQQTADTIGQQARRAGRVVQDTAQSLSNKFDPGAFFSQALAWVDAVLTPANRRLAAKALTVASALPRRHPVPAAVLGLGALYVLWQKSKGTSAREAVEDYADRTAGFAEHTRRSAARGYKNAASATRDARESLYETASRAADSGRTAARQFGAAASSTAEQVRDFYDDTRTSVSEGVEQLSDTARQLRKDAEAGYHRAREFAKEEPALAIAGGVALALGALLLVKSSRR